MNLYHILSIILLLSAVFSYINFRWIKLPQTIGLMVMSLATSIAFVLFGNYIPALQSLAGEISMIDFNNLLMKMMLGFLLFAGGFHVDSDRLKKQIGSILTLSTISTVLSTFIIGFTAYYLLGYFSFNIPLLYCLLFGALISPTDPIAVLGILKDANIKESLELKIAGESLFNDGVAVVIFLSLEKILASGSQVSFSSVMLLLLQEAGGGLLYGFALGYLGFLVLRSIDNYKIEVMITVAMVTAGYYFADFLHVSGPLAMVIAGLITGNKGRQLAMSTITRDYLSKFWELIDEILNAILFMLVGLEMMVITIDKGIFLVGSIMVVVALMTRWLSVMIPVRLISPWVTFEKNAITILTWGGLRGGISVALALSLSNDHYRNEFVAITYVIVVFSIIVQGLTVGSIARKLA